MTDAINLWSRAMQSTSELKMGCSATACLKQSVGMGEGTGLPRVHRAMGAWTEHSGDVGDETLSPCVTDQSIASDVSSCNCGADSSGGQICSIFRQTMPNINDFLQEARELLPQVVQVAEMHSVEDPQYQLEAFAAADNIDNTGRTQFQSLR